MRLPAKIGITMMTTANDVSPGAFVSSIFALTADAISAVYDNEETGKAKEETEDDSKNGKSLSEYEGYYAVEKYDWDVYLGLTKDGLFSIPIFSDNPADAMENWVHEEGDRFRRKRDDGTLAESSNLNVTVTVGL